MPLELLVASVLFWALTLGVLFLAPNQALFCYLLITEIDLAGFADPGHSSVIPNFVKVLILPIVLLVRVKANWSRWRDWAVPSRIWFYFVAYAALTILWSPDKGAAVKMIAYLVSYILLYSVFVTAWNNHWLSLHLILLMVWLELGLAAFQTYVGSGLFSTEGRFTAFCGPQDFAAFLVAALCLLLVTEVSRKTLLINTIAIVVGIVMSGSRYCFIGMICVFLIVGVSRARTMNQSQKRTAIVYGLIPALVVVGFAMWIVIRYLPDNRLNQVASSYSEGDIESVGTLVERFGIYRTALLQISDRIDGNIPELVFGSGTSSAAAVFSEFHADFFEHFEDPNRCIHDEFLRSLYEWGFVGLTLLLCFVVVTIFRYWRLAIRERSIAAWAVVAMAPTVILGLLLENVLVGATSGAGTGYLLVLSYGAAATVVATKIGRRNSGKMVRVD